MNKIRVFEAFSGIGAQAMSLKRLQAEYPDMLGLEFVGTSEIEPSAIKAYNAVHGDTPCYGDISKIDWDEVPDFDLFTMSSPCQDFSVAGRQAGGDEGSGTRSSLLWECRKAIIAKKPKYILFENVSAVVSKKFIRGFNKWQAELESYGYTNFAKVLNSKDYGICQNRERLFMISILDCDRSYHFPSPFKLEKRIKDILEPYGSVDESFYFSPEQILKIIANTGSSDIQAFGKVNNSQDGIIVTDDSISPCHCAGHGNVPKVAEQIKEGISIHPLNRKMEFKGFESIKSDTEPCLTSHDGRGGEPVLWQRLSMYADNAQAGRIYDVKGIAPTVKCYTGGNSEPNILEPCILGYTRDNNGKVCDRHDKNIANTVHTSTGNGGNTDQFVKEPIDRQSRIRSKVMPNGNIRFYQDDESKSGISEMQITHPDNECPTITTAHVPKILEPVAVAMRGRNSDNPSNRTKGAPTEQRLEFGDNIANCINTVQKDSMVAEPMYARLRETLEKADLNGNDSVISDEYNKVIYDDIAPTITTRVNASGNVRLIEKQPFVFANLPDKTVLKDEDGKGYLWQDGSLWRVRKLTPIEVGRLMDCSDEDIHKMIDAGISKSALYSLFGNSIVVNVLYHIFRKLWIDTENESPQKSLFDF